MDLNDFKPGPIVEGLEVAPLVKEISAKHLNTAFKYLIL